MWDQISFEEIPAPAHKNRITFVRLQKFGTKKALSVIKKNKRNIIIRSLYDNKNYIKCKSIAEAFSKVSAWPDERSQIIEQLVLHASIAHIEALRYSFAYVRDFKTPPGL